MNFDQAFDRLMGHEGGYANHPDDPGGETMWGITKRVAQANGYHGPMIDLSREMARRIAKEAYWDRAKCDRFDGAIAFQLMDAAYNSGIGNAVRFLQRAVDVADDGQVGPLTIAAVQGMPLADVLLRFNAERLEFLTKLATWPAFGKGWARRIAGNLKFASEDA